MSEKRRDDKGRLLRTGESQRSNGTYMYRFQDWQGNRKTIYAPSLAELREKAAQATKESEENIDSFGSKTTVSQQIDKYLDTNNSIRTKTRLIYASVRKHIESHPLSRKSIRDVRVSDAKAFCVFMSRAGFSYSTITIACSLLRPAFELAVEDGILTKNPFVFKLSAIIPKVEAHRQALRPDQTEAFLNFLREDTFGKRQLNAVIVLLGTGIRISELCGLTIDDLDFENRKICVNKQLLYVSHEGLQMYETKTHSGTRYVYMTDDVMSALRDEIISRDQHQEVTVGEYTNFVFLNRDGRPKRAKSFQVSLHTLLNRYNTTTGEKLQITPHVLRHTFCTEMVANKVDIKSVQYLMGHSDASVTLNTYAHSNYDRAAAAMESLDAARRSQK